MDAENTTEQPLMGTGKVWGGHAVFRTQKSISCSYCPYPPCCPLSLAFSNPCECLSFPNQNFSLDQRRENHLFSHLISMLGILREESLPLPS